MVSSACRGLAIVCLIVALGCSGDSEESASPPPEAPEVTKYATLHQAAAAGDLEDVKLHIRLEADVNAHDKEGRTALQRAVSAGHNEIAQYLFSQGAYNSRLVDTGVANAKE